MIHNNKLLKFILNNLLKPICYFYNKVWLIKKTSVFLLLFFFISIINSQTKSYKRGVTYGYHSINDMQIFSSTISWWYNWGSEPNSSIKNTYQNYGVDFTPMAWYGEGVSNVSNWVSQDSNVKYILGFNEPNFIDQAKMTPSEAAEAWIEFQAIAESNNIKTVLYELDGYKHGMTQPAYPLLFNEVKRISEEKNNLK